MTLEMRIPPAWSKALPKLSSPAPRAALTMRKTANTHEMPLLLSLCALLWLTEEEDALRLSKLVRSVTIDDDDESSLFTLDLFIFIHS